MFPLGPNLRKLLVIFGVAAIIACISHLCLFRWEMHSRLDLLTYGQVFYRLVPPMEAPGPRIFELRAKAVVKQRRCIGYLTREGFFVALGHDARALGPHALRLTITLLLSECLGAVVAGAVVVTLCWAAVFRRGDLYV